MKQPIPTSFSHFRTIREGGYKYIDKTPFIYKLCTHNRFCFLARPRRFGKSMTISTLEELFLGNKSLFDGLWIADKWDWTKKNPVIRLSFKDIDFINTDLENALSERIFAIALQSDIQLQTLSSKDRIRELVQALAHQNHKVVVLIDEYDAPILHFLSLDTAKAALHRDILKEFYTSLKENDAYLELVFLTGVTKFAKVGIFSGLNNLQDLTMDVRYGEMFGYTQEEVESYFAEEINDTAHYLDITPQALLEQIKYWYNGYKFHVKSPTVYNPISTNLFFDTQEFRNFWFETGTPTFLIALLKKEGLYDFTLEALSDYTFDSFDIEQLNPHSVLYQAGYLTLSHLNEDGLYVMKYPNYEVKHSMLAYLLEAFGGVRKELGLGLVFKMIKAFNTNDIPRVIDLLKTVFAGLPYQLYEKYPEKFYHAAIHLLFSYIGLRIHSEVCTSDGRVDATIETATHIYIFEFKLNQTAEIAFQQIIAKNYAQAYRHLNKPIVAVGINFAAATKNIDDYSIQFI